MKRMLTILLLAVGAAACGHSISKQNPTEPVASPSAPRAVVRELAPVGFDRATAIRSLVHPDGAKPASFFDLAALIRRDEPVAVRAFLADAPTIDKPEDRRGVQFWAPTGEVWGWKGVYNTNGYGIASWLRRAAHRYQIREAFTWLRKHVLLNVYNYWLYFEAKGRGPNEGVGYEWVPDVPDWVRSASARSGIPVGDLIAHVPERGYLVPKVHTWDGSSYDRHHTYDFVARCALDPDVPLTDAERERCWQMLEHYATTHLRKLAGRPYPATVRHEYGHYPIRTAVAIVEAFRQFRGMDDAVSKRRVDIADECLRIAEGIVWYGWHPNGPGHPTPIKGADGRWFWAWDQSTPANPAWHQLNQVATERPWYVGLRASAWAYLYLLPETSAGTRQLIAWVLTEEARWCSRDGSRIPPVWLDADRSRGAANGWLHGGFPVTVVNGATTSDRWVRAGRSTMSPDEWHALDAKTPYHPLSCIVHRESDAAYFARYWPVDSATPPVSNAFERWHYPKKRISSSASAWPEDWAPQIDNNGGSWFGVPDLLFVAGVLRGDREMVKTAMWLVHDYIGFSNQLHSGDTFATTKAKFNRSWYGFHRNRGFYFIAMCGEVLRTVALDQPDYLNRFMGRN